MYLELADRNEQNSSGLMLPIRNPSTDEIIMVTPEILNSMDPVEFSAAMDEMPSIVTAMQVKSGVDPDDMVQTSDLIQAAINEIDTMNTIVKRNNELITNKPYDGSTKWSGGFSIEPSAKPFYLRPEVLIPAVLLVGFTIYSVTKSKK